MYEPGKILKLGGSINDASDAVATVSWIDMTAPSPAWQNVAAMDFARRNHNATILPDGKVLVTGGNLNGTMSGAVLEAEMYDPVTNTWTTLPAMASNGQRWYHSTAMLLRDGRVVAAVGNNKPSQQIFRPPYLDGDPPRPVIVSPPATMVYATTYTISFTPTSGMRVTGACLTKLGAVTHSFDHDQRRVPLAVGGGTGGVVTLVAPANANLAPPGYYLLWLINQSGVPSEGAYVRLGAS